MTKDEKMIEGLRSALKWGLLSYHDGDSFEISGCLCSISDGILTVKNLGVEESVFSQFKKLIRDELKSSI